MNLFRAELLKAVTTRLLLWYGLGLLAFLTFVVSTHIGTENRFNLTTESTQQSVFQAAGLAAVTAALLGTVLMASEYNHGTINQSFLAAPVRERLLAAKLAAAILVAGALAVVADVATLLIAEIWYGARGLTLHLDGATLKPLLGAVGASMLAAGIGAGVGALLRRQTSSIVVILLWLLIGENVIAFIHGAPRYAPGHVIAAVVVARGHGSNDTLAVWPAVLLALAYVVILCAAGFVAAARSDVPGSGE
jgi:ABC-type transport system involved in multi-copper enzyme maturation permease subunit